MQDNQAKQPNKNKKIIIILIIIAVVAGGVIFAVTKASDIKLPSHSDMRRNH